MADIVLRNREGIGTLFHDIKAIQVDTTDGETVLFMTGDNIGDFLVTYMNDDGSETLYAKPIMYGDTCGDVIALGLLEKPTKESTDNAEYSFLGWSESVGGSVNNSVFETVTENKLVYAVFNAIIIIAKGECGETASWKLIDDGTFTIWGVGEMEDYASADARPWHIYRTLIDEVNISEGITSVGEFSFRDCANIKKVHIPDSVTSIDKNAFHSCTSLSSINIPSSVTTIGYAAFASCTSLTNIDIPDSVTIIDQWAFSKSGLTTITVPGNVTKISDNAFNGCTSLKTVDIQEGVTEVGNAGFSSCSSITSVNMPNSVTTIGATAFNGNTSLTSIRIPKNVTLIRVRAFYGCSKLTSVVFDDPNGWSVATSASSSNWTSVNVSNASTAAQYFRSTYVEYVWKKQ